MKYDKKVHQLDLKEIEFKNNKIYTINTIDKEVLNEDSEFLIGDLSKFFTVILLLILNENGKFDIYKKVGDYLNNKELKNVKIIDLINEKVSLNPFLDDIPKYFKTEYKSATHVYNTFKNGKKTITKKSNIFSYIILGAIIESALNDNYKNIFETYLFKPLNLKHTGMTDTNITLYIYNKLKIIKEDKYKRTYECNANGFKSSISDLIKFSSFPKLLNKKSLNILKKIDCFKYNEINNGSFEPECFSNILYEFNKKFLIKNMELYFKTNYEYKGYSFS